MRDAGGNFDTIRTRYHNATGETVFGGTYAHNRRYNGRMQGTSFPYFSNYPVQLQNAFCFQSGHEADILAWAPMSSDTLVVPGTKFIADTIPTNPMLDASVSLAELYREGLPSLVGSSILKDKVGLLRGVAGDYLSYQFGWKPIVSDLKAAAKAIMDQESILRQLERDSGRDVHRKRFLPAEVVLNNATAQIGTLYPSGLDSSAYSGQAKYLVSDHQVRKQWFSGAYTYHFEPDRLSEVSRIATEARHLYGLELTPEVVWNLAPWSWLVDWITNVGSVFHNVSAFQQDGLVLRYGYVMEENSRTWTRSNWAEHQVVPGYSFSHPLQSRETCHALRKARRKATPYGFGLLESSFSVRQWAILAALGITRAPNKLPI